MTIGNIFPIPTKKEWDDYIDDLIERNRTDLIHAMQLEKAVAARKAERILANPES